MGLKKTYEDVRAKDPDSPRMLYDAYRHRVYRTAYFVTKDCHLADDVVQETFFKAFRRIGQLNHYDNIGAWLSVIAKRTAIDLLRRRKGHIFTSFDPQLIENDSLHSCKGTSIESFTCFDLREMIDQLSPKHRTVITMKYMLDMKEEEIADRIGVSQGAVKSRLYHARIKLKQSIESSV
jgi:RNA polymerase sigma factor (sigma-70 family)